MAGKKAKKSAGAKRGATRQAAPGKQATPGTMEEGKPTPQPPGEEQPDTKAPKRKRQGEVIYVCMECGGDLKRNKGGYSTPAFLVRDFVCLNCGRETDQYITKRKIIRL